MFSGGIEKHHRAVMGCKKIMILLDFCEVLSTYHVLDNCVEVNIRKI